MEFVAFWLFGAVVVGLLASSFGRTGFGWFLISLLISPLIAALFVLVLPRVGNGASPKDEAGQSISPKTHVRCPDCRELVRSDARKCKHCGVALIPQ